MKHVHEQDLLVTALRSTDRPAGTVLATFQIELPMSNGSVCVCAFLQPFRQKPVAILQDKNAHWTYTQPAVPNGCLLVPIQIYKYLRRTLHRLGIVDLIGIEADTSIKLEIPEQSTNH